MEAKVGMKVKLVGHPVMKDNDNYVITSVEEKKCYIRLSNNHWSINAQYRYIRTIEGKKVTAPKAKITL